MSKNPKYEGDDEQTVLARLDNPHTSLAQRRLKKLDTSLFVLGDLCIPPLKILVGELGRAFVVIRVFEGKGKIEDVDVCT